MSRVEMPKDQIDRQLAAGKDVRSVRIKDYGWGTQGLHHHCLKYLISMRIQPTRGTLGFGKIEDVEFFW